MAFLFGRKFKCTNNTIIKNDVYIAKRCLYRRWDFIFTCNTHIPCIYPYHHALQDVYKPPVFTWCDFKCINISFCKEPRCGKVDAVCSIDRPYLLLYRPCTFEWFLVNEKWKLDFVWERHGKGSPYSYYPCTIPQLFLESFCQCVN